MIYSPTTVTYSADVILQELTRISPEPQVRPGLREKKLAYVQSFMLLTGLAFENLIKGIFIARDPSLVGRKKLDTRLWESVRKGHGISTLAKEVTSLTPAELNLLTRLEEYLVWAGRYPIPRSSFDYFKSLNPDNLRRYKSTDPKLIDELFQRLSDMLESARRTEGSS